MGANTARAAKSQKKKQRDGQEPKKDTFEVICYNCNKKGHYSKNCIEQKNLLQSWQFLR